ncbi:MAG: ribosome small subunit-dependent GTPase A [Chloroflexota bacterium]|nr:ribosome small subunit-dependent GTPase A [Chloroflexota bacterium]MDE2951386.1 ribosome small subunit-dependent GTPase A [Chloroflexota bacterium]
MGAAQAGLIVKEQSGFYWVEATDGNTYVCELRGKLKEAAQSSDIAAIGDRVSIATRRDEGTGLLTGVVEALSPRKSVLSRAVRTTGKRGAGQAEREQVIIANADRALFVVAAAQPPPDLELLDRLLVAGEKSRISDLYIVVNKVDLPEAASIAGQFAPYERMGYRVLRSSALRGDGIAGLRSILDEGISVFTGPSGVGKTSLLNRIQPGLGRQVKSVGRVSEEGVHTTRDSALIRLESGGYLADTPGIRSINVWDIEPDELDAYFVDIQPYVLDCKFSNCTHSKEPDCGVRRAVSAGNVERWRYRHYLELCDELRETYIIYNR